MSIHLVTGQGLADHVTSADAGSLHAGIMGTGRYVLNRGNKFAYEVVSNNLIKVKDGDLLNQGRQIRIANNDYEECVIENGLQSVFRNDLIVLRYSKNTETEIETATVEVIKGVSGDTAVDPSYTTGNILNGDTMDDFPLYRVRLNGLNIEGIDTLFTVNKSVKELEEQVNTNETNIETLDNEISELNTSLATTNTNVANKATSISVNGTTLTLKKSDGTTLSTVTTQDTNTWRGIVDNVGSTSRVESLSAYQGYLLNLLIAQKVIYDDFTSPAFNISANSLGYADIYIGKSGYTPVAVTPINYGAGNSIMIQAYISSTSSARVQAFCTSAKTGITPAIRVFYSK